MRRSQITTRRRADAALAFGAKRTRANAKTALRPYRA